MHLLILASEHTRNEMMEGGLPADLDIQWISDWRNSTLDRKPEAIIDLSFHYDPERVAWLAGYLPAPVLLNTVVNTCAELGHPFIRFNGWPGFIKNQVWELTANTEEMKAKATELIQKLGKRTIWCADTTGLVSPRVISMIINEAYLALEEGVSNREQIDTAMKKGTNYPWGPFEWVKRIGACEVFTLLEKLSAENNRFTPANLLKQEVENEK